MIVSTFGSTFQSIFKRQENDLHIHINTKMYLVLNKKVKTQYKFQL